MRAFPFRLISTAALLCMLLAGMPAREARAAAMVVNTDTDKFDLSIYDGLCGLREAIANANNDAATYPDCIAGFGTDSITFAADYTITLGNELLVTTAISIGGRGAANTIIQANANPNTATYRVFYVIGTGSLTLDGLTVRNGRCDGSCATEPGRGGGIYTHYGDLTVTNSVISANSGGYGGGGIYNDGGVLVVTNTTLSANWAAVGGGILNYASSPSLTNVVFSGNSANTGAGMANSYYGNATIKDVTFSNNSALARGGGIDNFQSSPSLTNVTFAGNSASSGGGMYNEEGSGPTLRNVTFSGNSAAYDGGGMSNVLGSYPTLVNVTFSLNSGYPGGGLHNLDSSPTLVNTLVASSLRGGDCAGSLSTLSTNNLIEDSAHACGLTDGANGNIVGQDPILGPLADHGGFTETMALLAGSPALNTGGASMCPSEDQRGMPRPQGSHCDIGAFEAEVMADFRSTGTQDGWVLESSETSGSGASLDAAATQFHLGDDSANRQYRAILSFNTASLPDTAVITSATLKIKKTGLVGANPFGSLGNISVDIKNGSFSSNAALQKTDFKAMATKNYVAKFTDIPVGSWYATALGSSSFGYINLSGATQVRLRFATDDNNNHAADYLKFASGNAITSSRPTLSITYYVP